jgi:hypothetical protein
VGRGVLRDIGKPVELKKKRFLKQLHVDFSWVLSKSNYNDLLITTEN